MIKSFLTFIALTLVQSVQPPAPITPKMGPPPPPGDVPLDNHIFLLVVVALIVGALVVLRNSRVKNV